MVYVLNGVIVKNCSGFVLVFGEVVFVISDPIRSMYEIFAYMSHKNQPNVGKYSSPMDGMGGWFHTVEFPTTIYYCWWKKSCTTWEV